MATTLETTMDDYNLDCDPLWIEISTDEITTSNRAQITIQIVGPTDTLDYLNFTFDGISIAFTFAVSPDTSGNELPEYVSGALSDYRDDLMDAIKANYNIATHWETQAITFASNPSIRMTARSGLTEITLMDDDLSTNILSFFNGPEYEFNQQTKAWIKPFMVDGSGTEIALPARLSPYEIETQSTCFNLSSSIELKPTLPGISPLGPDIDLAIDSFAKVFFQHGEYLGDPPQPQALITSPDIYMIHGGLSETQLKTGWEPPLSTKPFILCHSYQECESGNDFQKPVMKGQPDWVYLFTKDAISIDTEMKIYYNDGTDSTHSLNNHSLLDKTMYWIKSGWDQNNGSILAAGQPGNPDPVAYEFRIKEGGLLQDTVQYSLVCDCHPWNCYLLMFNGLGGCESVLLKGKKIRKYNGARDVIRKTKWKDYNLADGQFQTIDQVGQMLYEVNSGWHSQQYVNHLRQMLLGEIWLIDTDNNRFLKAIPDTNTIEVKGDDKTMYSFDYKFRAGFLDCFANCV